MDDDTGSVLTLDTQWLNWHQSFGGSNGGRIGTSIRHTMHLNHSVSFKNLDFGFNLYGGDGDPFWELVITFQSFPVVNCNNEKGMHYHYPNLNRCAVRITLTGSNMQNITRCRSYYRCEIFLSNVSERVHMDCKEFEERKVLAGPMILATYVDPRFISEDQVKGLKIGGVILPTEELGEIEIYGQLEICCYRSEAITSQTVNKACQIHESSKKWFRQDLSFDRQQKLFHSSFKDELRVDSGEADVKFVMEYDPEKILSAHNFVLAARSPVLRKMLTIDMFGKRNYVINIADASYASLELFLKLLHGSKTPDDLLKLPACDVLKILALAHKYRVVFLMRISCMIIMTYENMDVNAEVIQEMHHLGCLYDLPDLEQRAFEWLKWRAGSVNGYKLVLDLLEKLDERFMRRCCSFLFKFSAYELSEPYQNFYDL